jgi:hypothetical protein
MQYFADQSCIGRSLEWYGEYLQPQLDLLSRLIVAGSTVLERAAGVGAHALFLASAVGAAGRLFLCERDEASRFALRQNLSSNRVTNSTLPKPQSALLADGESMTIDRFRFERLDWIKLNEGPAAVDELEGAQETIWRLRPRLFIAARDGVEFNAIATRAGELGYRCWRIETPLFNPANFNRREADIFDGKRATALLAVPEEVGFDIALDERISPV